MWSDLDPRSRPLRRKAFQLLAYLLAHRERVVPKDELLDHLWPAQVIRDAALNACLLAVRKAMGDSGQAPRYIQTFRGFGYRFVAAVEVLSASPPGPPVPEEVGALGGAPPAQMGPPCPVCQHGQRQDASFCPACGTRLHQGCPHCGQMVRLPATLCTACGQSLEAPPEPVSGAARAEGAPRGESPPAASPVFAEEYKWVLGYADLAREKVRTMLTLTQEGASPFSRAVALFYVARIWSLRGEVQTAQESLEALLPLAATQGFTFLSVYGMILRGWVLTALGQHEEGIAQMRQAIAAQRGVGTEAVRPMFLALLASAYEAGGQAEAGLQVVAEALALVDKYGVRYYEAELHRLQGALQLRLIVPEAPQAERCLQQALILARRQQAKSWELRTAVSLSRLWQQQGKQDDARQLLTAIYGWFTEGFDTADLQEARALLTVWGGG